MTEMQLVEGMDELSERVRGGAEERALAADTRAAEAQRQTQAVRQDLQQTAAKGKGNARTGAKGRELARSRRSVNLSLSMAKTTNGDMWAMVFRGGGGAMAPRVTQKRSSNQMSTYDAGCL